MDRKQILQALFSFYIRVVLVVRLLGGGDAFPVVYGIKTVNLTLLIALVALLVAYFYTELYEPET